jgi:hypothetical protein
MFTKNKSVRIATLRTPPPNYYIFYAGFMIGILFDRYVLR